MAKIQLAWVLALFNLFVVGIGAFPINYKHNGVTLTTEQITVRDASFLHRNFFLPFFRHAGAVEHHQKHAQLVTTQAPPHLTEAVPIELHNLYR